jgi:hypothetical protein
MQPNTRSGRSIADNLTQNLKQSGDTMMNKNQSKECISLCVQLQKYVDERDVTQRSSPTNSTKQASARVHIHKNADHFSQLYSCMEITK